MCVIGVDGDSQKKARKAIRTGISLPSFRPHIYLPIFLSVYLICVAKKGGKAISADFNVEDLCLDFTVTYMNNGRSLTCALVENGQDISVTSENIDQYLSLRLRHRMFDSIKEQLHAFLKGLTVFLISDICFYLSMSLWLCMYSRLLRLVLKVKCISFYMSNYFTESD